MLMTVMDLDKLYSPDRLNRSTTYVSEPRTEYQRDFDRIIFSSAFRRLQNKTQVFPLPGSVFVHNRLTHSLEVASVGRSLGNLIGNYIVDNHKLSDESKEFYKHSLYNVISSACLCHDIGNPAFGHSGEDAIASYFEKNEDFIKHYIKDEKEWLDFIHFEGNANAIRILTQHQNGKSDGGLRLTFSTLSAIAKYPCESIANNVDILHRKKFGFFQSEVKTFAKIAERTSMLKDNSHSNIGYYRHPFVWLVELADDICYNIIDLEDAHRLGIIDNEYCKELLIYLIECLEPSNKIRSQIDLKIKNRNEKISYLRAVAINTLVHKGKDIYINNFDKILSGELDTAIFNLIKEDCAALPDIEKFSTKYIYNHRAVVEIENAGYNVMYELLSHFIPPVLKDSKNRKKSEKKAVKLIPEQFLYDDGTPYQKILGVLDYVSGMTDNYAADLYKKIKGIEIGMTV